MCGWDASLSYPLPGIHTGCSRSTLRSSHPSLSTLMIDALIFAIHIAACFFAFFKYKKEGIGEGVLAVAFVIIIFSVGWTITTMLSKLVYPYQLAEHLIASLQGSQLSRRFAKEISIDTLSLLLLTIGESVFYYFYLRSDEKKDVAKTGE